MYQGVCFGSLFAIFAIRLSSHTCCADMYADLVVSSDSSPHRLRCVLMCLLVPLLLHCIILFVFLLLVPIRRAHTFSLVRVRVRGGADPSSAALFCVRSGPMEVAEGLNSSKEGEELFKEDRR